MTLEEARKHSGLRAAASLMLRREYNYVQDDGPDMDELEDTVDECVMVAFDGNVDEFVSWGMDYLSGGCGVSG